MTEYPTIQVIPITEIMPVIKDLQRQIAALSDKLDARPDESVLSDSETARRLKISIPTVRRWKAAGKINSIQTPKGRLCRVCDIEDYYK